MLFRSALYGAAKRGFVDGVAKDNDQAAVEYLKAVLKNVAVMDKGARESITNFEKGVGDVAITYENEVLTAQAAGKDDEAVYPPSSVLIENPVAVVDQNVDKHCVREVAEAFVDFLHTDEAKEIFLDAGYRSTDLATAQKGGDGFPAIEDLWDVDEFGGWDALNDTLFSDSGIVTQAQAG